MTSGNGNGIREIGAYAFDDANTWSFKTNRIGTDGSFYGYGNDLGRGLDVYRFHGLGRTVPALEPVDLKPVATHPGKGKKPRQGEVLPVLLTSGSGPVGGPVDTGLLLLVGLTALTAAAVTRRTRRGLAVA